MISIINPKFNYTYTHTHEYTNIRFDIIAFVHHFNWPQKMWRGNEIRSNRQSNERNVTLSHENTTLNINVLLHQMKHNTLNHSIMQVEKKLIFSSQDKIYPSVETKYSYGFLWRNNTRSFFHM